MCGAETTSGLLERAGSGPRGDINPDPEEVPQVSFTGYTFVSSPLSFCGATRLQGAGCVDQHRQRSRYMTDGVVEGLLPDAVRLLLNYKMQRFCSATLHCGRLWLHIGEV